MVPANWSLGRFAEPAMWVLIVLDEGPRPIVSMLDAVRRLDGPIGPGTLLGAVARLERLALVESADDMEIGRRAYRLTDLGRTAAGSAGRLKGLPA